MINVLKLYTNLGLRFLEVYFHLDLNVKQLADDSSFMKSIVIIAERERESWIIIIIIQAKHF